MTVAEIDAPRLRVALTDGGEIALIDPREQGLFGQNHLLLAVNIPLSRFELDIRDFVPRPGTRVVLCDAGEGEAKRAAAIMTAAGYRDVAVLAGGIDAWRAAGLELFSGINVPSKVFGEHVEHHFGTPSIAPEELKAKLDAGERLVILDSRPMDEYRKMSIPGGIDAPGAELVYRVHDLAPDPDTLVVVNCAGRTRSIIGCQSLINAGLPNKVVALRNGTMGWHLAGLEVERAAQRQCGPVSKEALAWSRAAASRVAQRFGVRSIDAQELARWRAEADQRTLYLLDVRFPEEFAAGHLPGSRSAPGGQLVQATDRYIATRNARIVLVDDTGVRATMTASWLVQMGWPEVAVLEGGLDGHGQETGPHRPVVPELGTVGAAQVTVEELQAQLKTGEAVVVDIAGSLAYRDEGHIPGAWWAIRSRLSLALPRLPQARRYVLTGAEANLAKLAAGDLARLTDAKVAVLDGGTRAWREAGLPLAYGMENVADEPIDLYYRAYDREEGVEEAMNQYLTWEIDLINQIARDGTLTFSDFPA